MKRPEADQAIGGITLFRLRLPLARPYHLAFGDLTAFETVLIHVRTADQDEGWGETTPLPGYSHEDSESVWRLVVDWSRALRGRSVAEALAFLDDRSLHAPFACAAIATALESLARTTVSGRSASRHEGSGGPMVGHPDAGARLPLIGTVGSVVPAEVAAEVPRLLDAGHTSLKLKVGTDVALDLANVRAAQEALGNGGSLRIDANQGYSLEETQEFLDHLDPAGVELFEQPFPANRWDWMEALGGDVPVPLMLDESIAGEDDLSRARDLPGVRYVKFKLMKAGSRTRLLRLMDRASALGLGVVVGNGVAGEIGCLHEAWAVMGRLDLPGEMNGFRKPIASLLAEPLQVVRGELVVPPISGITVVRERLDGCCVGFASV
ncbi:MAG TPA: enolase C-terminal domain-like protein [bacterium]|nr:enolase C-terminal domain-like protein [bacterium]